MMQPALALDLVVADALFITHALKHTRRGAFGSDSSGARDEKSMRKILYSYLLVLSRHD